MLFSKYYNVTHKSPRSMSVCSAVGLTIVSMVPHCESVLMTLGHSGQVGEDQVMLGE